MNNNQIMIFMLIKKREELKWKYYHAKSWMQYEESRKQELETITNVYLSNVDWIADKLRYYRGREKV